MRTTAALTIKRGLAHAGLYRRALARHKFPGVAVLAYHGVRADSMPAGSVPFENLHVRASTFAEHCALVREACHPISLDDWRNAAAGAWSLPDRPVLITFDDGYRSVLTMAAPILAAHELPAVVFACSGPMKTRTMLWFDELAGREGSQAVDEWKSRSYDEWRAAVCHPTRVDGEDPRALMTPSEIEMLGRQPGIEIGAHTTNHPILARASRAQQYDEIAGCCHDLHDWTGRAIRAFAYPNGRPGIDYSADTLAVLSEVGCDVAFTTQPAFATSTAPALERPRFLMVSDISGAELAHRLAYSWPR